MFKNTRWLTFIAYVCLGPRLVTAQRGVDQVPGAEFVSGANLTDKNVKAEGTIFLPDNTRRVRAVIVLAESWPGADRSPRRPFVDLAVGRFRDQAWRRLSETSECALLHLRLGSIRPDGSGDSLVNGVVLHSGISNRVVRNATEGGAGALLVILQRLGEESAHQELKDAPLVLWGWSAAASFGTTFARIYPERTVAFIRYHGHLRGLKLDIQVLRNTPALLIAGAKDEIAGTEDAETLWKSGRAGGAPWTFAIEPDATHASEEAFESSHKLIISWIAAVLAQRLAGGGTQLRPITENSAWLGNNQGGEIAPYKTFPNPKLEASWLPDDATARGWQAVLRIVK
jgi:hypothetical protein